MDFKLINVQNFRFEKMNRKICRKFPRKISCFSTLKRESPTGRVGFSTLKRDVLKCRTLKRESVEQNESSTTGTCICKIDLQDLHLQVAFAGCICKSCKLFHVEQLPYFMGFLIFFYYCVHTLKKYSHTFARLLRVLAMC